MVDDYCRTRRLKLRIFYYQSAINLEEFHQLSPELASWEHGYHLENEESKGEIEHAWSKEFCLSNKDEVTEENRNQNSQKCETAKLVSDVVSV